MDGKSVYGIDNNRGYKLQDFSSYSDIYILLNDLMTLLNYVMTKTYVEIL